MLHREISWLTLIFNRNMLYINNHLISCANYSMESLVNLEVVFHSLEVVVADQVDIHITKCC